jgi:pseudaminic acid biosynthesis-associated methylase
MLPKTIIMSNIFKTEQEEFWAGEFGSEYISRNVGEKLLASNVHFFSEILSHCRNVGSVLELGANVGMNLRALKTLLPDAELAGVEINETAYESLVANEFIKAYFGSIFDFQPLRLFDLVFIKGVLIHINPEMLSNAYEKLYSSSAKYICIAEYYNPTPVVLDYRGHSQKLFKRDFAGEFMKAYPDVELVKYGFAYRKDPVFPQDDITWFLFKKLI